jgi:hypothetical protein
MTSQKIEKFFKIIANGLVPFDLLPQGRAQVLNHDNFKTPSNAPLVESFAIRPYRGVILLKEGARGWRGQR